MHTLPHIQRFTHIHIRTHINRFTHIQRFTHTHTHGSQDIMEEGGGKNLRSRGRTGPNSVIWT